MSLTPGSLRKPVKKREISDWLPVLYTPAFSACCVSLGVAEGDPWGIAACLASVPQSDSNHTKQFLDSTAPPPHHDSPWATLMGHMRLGCSSKSPSTRLWVTSKQNLSHVH